MRLPYNKLFIMRPNRLHEIMTSGLSICTCAPEFIYASLHIRALKQGNYPPVTLTLFCWALALLMCTSPSTSPPTFCNMLKKYSGMLFWEILVSENHTLLLQYPH